MVGKMNTEFKHDSLDSRRHEFRLCQIVRTEGEANDLLIHCTIDVFDLAEAPEYLAVSYVWGPKLPVKPILLNGERFFVRENLHNFLIEMSRLSDGPHYFWVDQISIDQENVGERTHQVAFMGEIYASAERTIIWLGEGKNVFEQPAISDTPVSLPGRLGIPAEPKLVGPYLDHVDPKDQTAEETLQLWYEHDQRFLHDDIAVYLEENGHTVSPMEREWLLYIQKSPDWWMQLMFVPYFERLWWVVQEICLSQNITIWIGRRCLSWGMFRNGMVLLNLCNHVFRMSKAALNLRWLALYRVQPELQLGGRYTLKRYRMDGDEMNYALRHTSSLKCEDPRDAIYALLSLIRESRRITVDYTLSVIQLFERVAQHLLAEFRNQPTAYLQFLDQMTARLNLGKDQTKSLKIPISVDDPGYGRIVSFDDEGHAKFDGVEDARIEATFEDAPPRYAVEKGEDPPKVEVPPPQTVATPADDDNVSPRGNEAAAMVDQGAEMLSSPESSRPRENRLSASWSSRHIRSHSGRRLKDWLKRDKSKERDTS